jgi:molybdenum cofactor cytidylyltransferase
VARDRTHEGSSAPPARVAAIVLAAGESRRMGFPKALLPIEGHTFVEHILAAFAASRVSDAYVVLGAHRERILAEVRLGAAQVVVNDRWEQGQLSSLVAGLRALPAGAHDAVMMALVDHPLVDPDVVDSIIRAFEATGAPIVVPVHEGRRGHPVLFATRLVPELLAAPVDQGARAVVRAHSGEVLEVPSPAPGILADIDTPQLYAEWMRREFLPPGGEERRLS